MPDAYFDAAVLRFLVELSLNNRRDWFEPRKAQYETWVREPLRRLALDLQPGLAAISPHFVSDPRVQGGSLLRVHRDTRFSPDKRPYKTWAALKLFHQRGRQLEAPSFYLHLEPGRSFIGAGIWRPEPATLKRIREFLVDNPGAWGAARACLQQGEFQAGGEALKRAPRGYDPTHPLLDDLKRRDFVIATGLPDAIVLSDRLLAELLPRLQRAAPYVDYLCAALDLEF